MSYDLTIAEKKPDEDWDSVLDRLEAGADSEDPLGEARRETWQRVTDRLIALDPQFEPFSGPDLIEVSHTRLGIQVSLFDDEAGITIPYWYEDDASGDVMELVARVVDIVREESGWSVWDQQLDRELSSGRDLVADGSAAMSDVTERLVGVPEPKKPPWWKFWER